MPQRFRPYDTAKLSDCARAARNASSAPRRVVPAIESAWRSLAFAASLRFRVNDDGRAADARSLDSYYEELGIEKRR